MKMVAHGLGLSARRRSGRGLGEYPGYYCYDANRPSWLPYWLDDLTESSCKWNPKTIAGNIYACVTGDPSCSTPPPGQNPNVSGAGVDPSGYPQCGQFSTYNPVTQQCQVNVTSPSFLILAGGALLIVLVALKI